MAQFPLPFDPRLLVPGSRACVAVSGGADSVALLCAVNEACRNQQTPLGVGLSAVHVNHGLRGVEADQDEAFVHDLCERLGVPLVVRRVDVSTRRKLSGETVEEAARTLRYEVFRALLSGGGIEDVLTAHTLEDQAETVLMKLLRGSWTEGLSGIYPEVRMKPGRIIRPMLQTRRVQIEDYLRRIGQGWREDASNRDPMHMRNRIRHHVLPILREENPGLDETLANLAEIARDEEETWQDRLGQLLPQMLLPGNPVRGGGRAVSTTSGASSVSLEIERLRGLDKATRRRVLRAAARSLGDLARLSFGETDRLLALCGFREDTTVASRPGASLRVNHGLTAKRSARELTLALVPAKPSAEQ